VTYNDIDIYLQKAEPFTIQFGIPSSLFLNIPQSHPLNSYWTEAIASCTSIVKVRITEVEFSNRDWEHISNALARNSTLKDLLLDSMTLNENNVKYACKVIRETKQLKNLMLTTVTVTQPAFEQLCEALKTNTTLQELSFYSVGLSLNQFKTLSGCLEINRSIKKLSIRKEIFYPIVAECLKDIFLKNNNLNFLFIGEASFQANAFEIFSDMIKSTESLGELRIETPALNAKKSETLFNALKANKSIKKLVLDKFLKPELLFIGDLLSVNTTIEKLSLENIGTDGLTNEAFENLVKGLQENYSLRSLQCQVNSSQNFKSLCDTIIHKPNIKALKVNIRQASHEPLVELLKEARQLRSLYCFSTPYFSTKAASDIFEAMAVNKGLRKFGITEDPNATSTAAQIFDAIKVNDTLTHLQINTNGRYQRQFWPQMADALQDNKSLREILVKFDVIPADVLKLLERNRQEQLQHIRRLRGVIRVIVLRAQQFSSMLPLEIWAMILSSIELPGVTVDFGKVLVQQLNAQ